MEQGAQAGLPWAQFLALLLLLLLSWGLLLQQELQLGLLPLLAWLLSLPEWSLLGLERQVRPLLLLLLLPGLLRLMLGLLLLLVWQAPKQAQLL